MKHRWGTKTEFAHKSERECQRGCGIVKTTRHEGGQHWIEYWRGLEKLSIGKAPVCEKISEKADA